MNLVWNDDSLGMTAELAERVTHLPAVATLDWCDRAAQCLVGLPGAKVTGVMLATLGTASGDAGRILDLEAAGFASPAADPGSREHLLWLRSRTETLRSVGWSPSPGETFRTPVALPLSELPGGSTWRSGQLGQMVGDPAGLEIAIGHLALGDMVAGRTLTVLCLCEQAAAASVAGLIRAVLPVLGRRALVAIGPDRSTRNHWLSPREQLVLELLTLGRSVREIADELGRSPHTVHDHVKSLHRKLHANSRGELVARALGHRGPPPKAATLEAAAALASEVVELLPEPLSFSEPKPPVPTPTRAQAN